eukprot:SAG31_NODE_10377_length_1146_cov_1.239733_1_plen_245_part_01
MVPLPGLSTCSGITLHGARRLNRRAHENCLQGGEGTGPPAASCAWYARAHGMRENAQPCAQYHWAGHTQVTRGPMPPNQRLAALSRHLCMRTGGQPPRPPRAASTAAVAGLPTPTAVQLTQEQTYLFDLHGFLVLKQVVPPETIRVANRAMDEMELRAPPVGTQATAAGDLPFPCVLGDERTEDNLYISNIMEGNLSAFAPFMDVPEVLGCVSDVSMGNYRLNHTYSISRWRGGQTMLHGAGTPV